MKTYNIVNLLVNDDSTFEYKFPIVDKEGNDVDIFTSSQFFTKICQKYTSFSILCPRYYDDDAHEMVDMIADRSEAISYLQAIFTLWYDDRVAGVEKLYNTFRDNYNPLWNVDGVEGHVEETNQGGNESNVHSGHDDLTKGSGYTSTRTGNETDAPSGSNTMTTSKTTFDDSSFKDTDKVVNQPGVTATHTYNSVRDQYTQSGKDTTDYASTMTHNRNLLDKNVYMHIRQGNIGVTSSQSLIRQQFDITDLDQLIELLIKDFVHSNLVIGW